MNRENLGYNKPETNGGFVDMMEIEEGENFLRLVLGPTVRHTYWYSSYKQNEDGIFEERNHGIKANPKNKSIVHQLYSGEWNLLKAHGLKPQDANRIVNKSVELIYLGFNVKDKMQILRPVRIPKTVSDRIDQFVNETFVNAPQFLKNGLLFMFDIKITKTITPGMQKRFGTKYTVDVYETYAPKYSLPITLLDNQQSWMSILAEQDTTLGEKAWKIDWETFFSEEQLAAIDASDQEPETMFPYKSNTEVANELMEFPVLLTEEMKHFSAGEAWGLLEQLAIPAAKQLPEPEQKPMGDIPDSEFEDAPEGLETAEEVKADDSTFPDFLNKNE